MEEEAAVVEEEDAEVKLEVEEEEEEVKLEEEEEAARRRSHSGDRPAHFQHVSRHTRRRAWEQVQVAFHNWRVAILKVGQAAVLIGSQHFLSFFLFSFFQKKGFYNMHI